MTDKYSEDQIKQTKFYKKYLNGRVLNNIIDKKFSKSQSNEYQLFISIMQNDLYEVKSIIELDKSQLNMKKELGFNCLHFAVALELLDISKYLIEQGVDVNELANIDGVKISAAAIAIIKSNKKILHLIKPLKFQKEETLSLIHISCIKNDIETLQYLLEFNPDINQVDLFNQLPIQLTHFNKIIQMLEKYQEQIKMNKMIKKTQPVQQEKISQYCGELYKLSKRFYKKESRFVVLNLVERTFKRYKVKSDYPHKPNGEIINLDSSFTIRQYEPNIFLSKNLFYFEIQSQNERQIYMTQFESTLVNWVCLLQQARTNVLNLETHKQLEILDQPCQYLNLDQNVLVDLEQTFKLNYNEIISRENNQKKQNDLQINNPIKLYDSDINFNQFEILKELGGGAFGQVFIVQKIDTKKLYAMKVQLKKKLILDKKLHYVVSEQEILKNLKHPFIIQMNYSFQTPLNIYFIMEYCPGIDLYHQLKKKLRFTEDEAKFYICELIIAIEFLHKNKIIYRDMKPDNVLIGEDGHIKLTDFGLAKQNVDLKKIQKSICGSPVYASPEIINLIGANASTDVYGIGVMLYELIGGTPPFSSFDIQETLYNIKFATLEFNKLYSADAQDLISKMMNRDIDKRLGVNGWDEIKNHKFFKNVDWQQVENLTIPPPIIPKKQTIKKKKNVFEDFDYDQETQHLNRVNGLTFIENKMQLNDSI